MKDKQIFGLLVDMNPVPDPDGLESPLALSDFETKSGVPMQAGQRTTPRPSPTKRRSVLVATLAFLSVVVVGLVLFLATTLGGDEGFDAAAASPVETAEEFLTRLDDGDIEGAAALVSDSHSGIRFPIQGRHAGAGLVDFFGFYEATNGRTEFTNCAEIGTGGIVSCEFSQSSDVVELLGISPLTASMTFTIADRQVRAVNFTIPGDALVEFISARDGLEAWIFAARPETAAEIFAGGEVIKTAEAGEVYLQLASEYASR